MWWNPTVLTGLLFGREVALHLFSVLTMLIAVALYSKYCLAMVKGTEVVVDGKLERVPVTPPRSTWFIWLTLDVVALSSAWAAQKFDVLLFSYTVGTLVVASYTLKYGKKGWGTIDTLCSAAVFAAILLWLAVGPSFGLWCALFGMFAGMLPIYYGILWEGKHEDRTSWILGLLMSVSNLLDGEVWVSLYLITIQGMLLLMLFRPTLCRGVVAWVCVQTGFPRLAPRI